MGATAGWSTMSEPTSDASVDDDDWSAPETVWPPDYEAPYQRMADDLGVTVATVQVWEQAGGGFRFEPQDGWSWWWDLHLN